MRKENKKLTDSITEMKQAKVFEKESSVFAWEATPDKEKKPFSKGFVSVRARREGKNKFDVLLRALHFFAVKIVSSFSDCHIEFWFHIDYSRDIKRYHKEYSKASHGYWNNKCYRTGDG